MCKARKCPAITLGIFSVITLLFGVAVIVLSIRFKNYGIFKEVKAIVDYRT